MQPAARVGVDGPGDGNARDICAYDSAVNAMATPPTMYARATMPPAVEYTLPKMPKGAIGTMKISPYTSRSPKLRERRSSCR